MTQLKMNVRFNLIVLCSFSILAIVGVLHHEIWLDEAHHWLFARDSETFKELWSNMRYDGHPILWNIILFIASRFSHDVVVMQFLNVLFAVGAVGIFLFFAPFRMVEKILFVSGYFFLYEYTVISRNYALLILFLFLALTYYGKRKHLALGVTIAVLANTHLFGLLFALLIAGMILFDWFAERTYRFDKQLVIGALIFIAGMLLSLYQVFPPGDSVFYAKAQEGSVFERLGRTSTVFLKGFIPFPDFLNQQFWNTNALMEISKPVCVVFSLTMFALPLIFFRKRFSVVLFFYLGAAVLILFFFLSGLNAVRYYGFTYLLLICCFWFDRSGIPSTSPVIFTRFNLPSAVPNRFLMVLLIIQVFAAVPSYILDIKRPFSNSENAANVILNDSNLSDYLSAGCGAAPVSSYLMEKVFYLNIQSYGSFCLSGKPGSADEVESRVVEDALQFVDRSGRSAFLITHFRMSESSPNNFKLVGAYEQSITRNENYFIYRVDPD